MASQSNIRLNPTSGRVTSVCINRLAPPQILLTNTSTILIALSPGLDFG